MNAAEVNVHEFKNIAELYEFADKHALLLERNADLLNIWVKYRDYAAQVEEKQFIQWEIETSMYNINGNIPFAYSYSNGKEPGIVTQYPDLNNLQTDAFEYLKGRAKTAKSSILLAKYNLLLWKGLPEKNRTYAISSIEYYFKAIEEHYALLIQNDDGESNYKIGDLYETAAALCNEINVKADLIKITKWLLYNAPEIKFFVKHGIIEDMLKYPKIFKPAEFADIPELFEKLLIEPAGIGNKFHLVNYYLPTAIIVAQKTGKDVKRWHNEVGLAHLSMAEADTDESRSWMKVAQYDAAIHAFMLAGNEAKKKETEQLLFELKPKVKLDTFKLDFDDKLKAQLEELHDELKENARKLLNRKPEAVYNRIASGDFFPKRKDVFEASKGKRKHFPDGFTTMYFDNNKNVTVRKDGENEREQLFKTYALKINGTLLPFLHYVIIDGIKKGKLTYENLIGYLVNHTWIGRPVVKTDLGGEPYTTYLIKQIAPALVEFFVQVQSWGESKYFAPNFILCTDSLTLKIEALLRSFCEMVNVSTTIGKTKGTEQVNINNILENHTIRKYFDEDDLLFFEYVFSKEAGINLRNNIAHSFYSEEDYNPDLMLLLIAVLLRIGKYNVRAKAMAVPSK